MISLQALPGFRMKNPKVKKKLSNLHDLTLLAHVSTYKDIFGNEKADSLEKEALRRPENSKTKCSQHGRLSEKILKKVTTSTT